MAKHTITDLYQMQSLTLEEKVRMTQRRIQEWVDEFGIDGVYISFSGGKDSTVLLHIARKMFPDIKAMYVDTGLEYPEIRDFVKTYSNVDWVKPKKNFKQITTEYGVPMLSKEISECVEDARIYKKAVENGEKPKYKYRYDKICGVGKYAEGGQYNQFNCKKYKFFLDAPFEISPKCCRFMKKFPAHDYAKQTGRKPIIATMASESKLRAHHWLQHGCNGFDLKLPTSNPMSFWTDQDVLLYVVQNNIALASVYGDVFSDNGANIDGQMELSDFGLFDKERPCLKTTGCQRTGCMYCLFGIQFDKEPNRLQLLKQTHPKTYEYIMKPDSEGGLGYKEKIDWINERGNMNIKY